MAKKSFVNPFLLLLDVGGDEEDEGVNSGHGSTDLYPCSFEDWSNKFVGNYDGNDTTGDFADYKAWWIQYLGGDLEAWNEFNDVPLYDSEPDPAPEP